MRKSLLLVVSLVVLLAAGCARGQKTWITDLDTAAAKAGNNGKSILLAFTGSDWNDESKLFAESLFTEKFFALGSKEFVLCNVDVVKNEELLDEETREKNYQLAQSYAVQQIPSFFLLTPDKDIYGMFSVEAATTTIDSFYEQAASYTEARDKLITLKKKISESEGLEKAGFMDQFMEAVSPQQRDNYRNFIEEITTLDADSTAGLKPKYLLQLQYMKAVDLYQAGNLGEAGEGFFELARGGLLEPAKKQEALYMGTYMYAMSETIPAEQLIAWLEEAIAADPENPGVTQIVNTIEQIKQNDTGQ